MPQPLEPEEIEEIRTLIEQDLLVKEIMDQTGRSRSTVFKVAKDAGLSLATSDSKARSGPYDEADRVTYARSKGFIRGETGRVYDDIMEVGTAAVQKYRKEAHEHGTSVIDYIDRAIEFFKAEILMVETRKYVIEELEKENKQLRASLSVMGIVKDMTMQLLREDRNIDFNQLLNAARAISMAANEGAYEYGEQRDGIEPDGEETGTDQGPVDGPGIEPTTDTNPDDITDDEPTPEEQLRGPEGLDGHENDDEHNEPGEDPEPGDGSDAGHPESTGGGQEGAGPGETIRDIGAGSERDTGTDAAGE